MANFVSTLGLEPLLRQHGIVNTTDNFEAVYSSLFGVPKYRELIQELEQRIRTYFSEFQLPDHPTVYDHLLLGLREKDFIATFNWDPLLPQAYERNRRRLKELPTMLFLHGSVAAAYCPMHLECVGHPSRSCTVCNEPLKPSPLLYPVERKDYSNNGFIAREWKAVRYLLGNSAFMLTIFGYSAPKSDVDAVELIRSAWDENRSREMAETEIIDVKPKEQIETTWEPFFFSHHYELHSDFYESSIARNPRRSLEALWARIGEARFVEADPIPRQVDFAELYRWLEPYLEVERAGER